ncbi:zeta toxin family protein [Nocardia nova]|uniref:zeta toxin family protein n=1 Tax=Nocardia TaxID=1817 RepID=UPI002B4B17C8|nr:zeta toxin family protein [Nocardia nova]
MTSAVYLITGIQAAGKSTVAQALAERLPRSAHVRGDVFRRFVRPRRDVRRTERRSHAAVAVTPPPGGRDGRRIRRRGIHGGGPGRRPG